MLTNDSLRERAKLEASEKAEEIAVHNRNVMAQQDLKALEEKPAIGQPFHKILLPEAILHPHK